EVLPVREADGARQIGDRRILRRRLDLDGDLRLRRVVDGAIVVLSVEDHGVHVLARRDLLEDGRPVDSGIRAGDEDAAERLGGGGPCVRGAAAGGTLVVGGGARRAAPPPPPRLFFVALSPPFVRVGGRGAAWVSPARPAPPPPRRPRCPPPPRPPLGRRPPPPP